MAKTRIPPHATTMYIVWYDEEAVVPGPSTSSEIVNNQLIYRGSIASTCHGKNRFYTYIYYCRNIVYYSNN